MPNIDEMSLKERFEAASQDLAADFLWKARRHNEGTRLYPGYECYADLRKASDRYDLFPIALWFYFRMLHPPGDL
jgi:hypothetical protein